MGLRPWVGGGSLPLGAVVVFGATRSPAARAAQVGICWQAPLAQLRCSEECRATASGCILALPGRAADSIPRPDKTAASEEWLLRSSVAVAPSGSRGRALASLCQSETVSCRWRRSSLCSCAAHRLRLPANSNAPFRCRVHSLRSSGGIIHSRSPTQSATWSTPWSTPRSVGARTEGPQAEMLWGGCLSARSRSREAATPIRAAYRGMQGSSGMGTEGGLRGV